jgi:hypothetical protein
MKVRQSYGAGLVVVLAVLFAVALAACGSASQATSIGLAAPVADTVAMIDGALLRITPTHIGATEAQFQIATTDESGVLPSDLGQFANLTVSGVAWPVVGWSPSARGGEYGGILTFQAAGPARGTVELSIRDHDGHGHHHWKWHLPGGSY